MATRQKRVSRTTGVKSETDMDRDQFMDDQAADDALD